MWSRAVVTAVLCGLVAACAEASSNCVATDRAGRRCGDSAVRLSTSSAFGGPTVNGTVNGQAVQLLIDTGAEAVVMAPGLVNGAEETWVSVSELCFESLCFQNLPVWAWSTPFSQEGEGVQNGFVGMSLLSELGVRFRRGEEVELLPVVDGCAGADADVTFSERGIPALDVQVNGEELGRVSVDSGSTHSLMSDVTVERLSLPVGDRADVCTAQGCVEGAVWETSAAEYCVAGACAADVSVKYPLFDAVGGSYLDAVDLLFDFPNARATFCEQ